MSASDNWPWRGVLLLAALDAATLGYLGTVRPALLFDQLGVKQRNDTWAWQLLVPRGDAPDQIPPPRDAGLGQLLALFWLGQAGFLGLAAWRPRTLGGLAAVPLIGHALGAALWLWALGAASTFPENRKPFSDAGILVALAVHDGVWLALLAAFLIVRRRIAPLAPASGARGWGRGGFVSFVAFVSRRAIRFGRRGREAVDAAPPST